MVPKVYGGAELDLDTFFETVLVLGEADASAAWILSFYIEHNWMLCQFPEPFQREVFAESNHTLAPAMLSPAGTTTRRARRLPARRAVAMGDRHRARRLGDRGSDRT